MNSFIAAIQAVIKSVFEFLGFGYALTQPPPRDPTLRAEFETDQKIFSRFNEGFCIDGKRSLSLKDSLRHAIIVGKSGIGKSTINFSASLLTMHTSGSSFITHDPSKELFEICSGHLKTQGYSVMVLDFGDPARSIGFNPLSKIKSASDIDMISGMLVRTTLKSSDPFWDTSAQNLIKCNSQLALSLPNKDHHNLSNVFHLIKMINGNRKRYNELVAKFADDATYLEISAFLANDPKVLSGIVASATAALSIFGNEKVATITSQDTLDFRSLRKRKIALFVQNNVASLTYYNPIISLFFEMLFSSFLSELPKPKDKSIYLLLDEFASGLTLPSFANCIAHLRKYKVGVLIGIQTLEQLKTTYKADEATTIVSNCNVQMYFSEQSHPTTKLLEEMLGRYHYEDEQGNKNLTRNLMEADEIRMLGKNRALIFVGSEKPIISELTPFYERIWLKMRANLKVPKMFGVGHTTSLTFAE